MKSNIKYLIYFIFVCNSLSYPQMHTSYVIKVKDINQPIEALGAIVAEAGVEEIQVETPDELNSMKMQVVDLGVELNQSDAEEVLLQLKSDENIEYVESNIPHYIDGAGEQELETNKSDSPSFFIDVSKAMRSSSTSALDSPLTLSPREKVDSPLTLSPREKKEGQYFSLRHEKNAQWPRIAINALASKPLSLGEPSILIALLDTGIDKNHKDLIHSFSNIIKGLDTIEKKEVDVVQDLPTGHGTHCAGIMVGSIKSKMVPGIAPYCKLIPIKVMHQNENGGKPFTLTSWIIRGIKYAADNGAKVINMSFSSPQHSQFIAEAVKYAQEKGCLLVAAAGNSNTDTKHYPAGYDDVLSVGAINRKYEKLEESNYGDWVSVCAPGKGVYSTFPNNKYKKMKGTSMACPHVSALAALLFSLGGDEIKPLEVKHIIESTCKKIEGASQICQNGLIDIKKALEYYSGISKTHSFSLVDNASTDLGKIVTQDFLNNEKSQVYHLTSEPIEGKKFREYIREEFTFNVFPDQFRKIGWIRMKIKADQPIEYKLSIYNKITGKYDVLMPYKKYSKENYDLNDDLNNDQINTIIDTCKDTHISSDKKLKVKLTAKNINNTLTNFFNRKKNKGLSFNLIVEDITYGVNNMDNILYNQKNRRPSYVPPYPLSISLSDPLPSPRSDSTFSDSPLMEDKDEFKASRQ